MKLNTVLMVCLLVSGCSSFMRPEVRYSEDVDYSRFQSFTWLNMQPLLLAPEAVDSSVVSAIEQSIINDLQSKGYAYTTDPFNADLIVSFALESTDADYELPSQRHTEETDVCTPPITEDQLADADERPTTEKQYLMLNIFDNVRCINVWHGRIETTFNMFDVAANQQQKITSTVDRLLAEYPPQ